MSEKNTNFKILSHACLLIQRGNTALIIDPWLSGSCYWRSWWNYPEPELDEHELQQVTHVMISHIHWDHWHGTSLKKFFKGRQYIIPDEPKTRSYDDLCRMRLGDVRLIKHGQSLTLGVDIKITVYQFGLFLNDTAIVIETPEVRILNANDVKIAGWPLKTILRRHGHFDFALRSHSTANFRACIQLENSTQHFVDDNDHYSRSFKLFMDAVRPTYAIPFASNHCHLHKDSYAFNQIITNPIKLKQWLDEHGQLDCAEFKIMLPGSSWSSRQGFQLRSLEPFDHLEEKIEQLQQKKQSQLQQYYQQESQQSCAPSVFEKHASHLKSIPTICRKLLKNNLFGYQLIADARILGYYTVDFYTAKITEVDEKAYLNTPVKIVWPALIFKQAVSLKMYAHALISKRVKFYVAEQKYLKNLYQFLGNLEKIEHELYPLRWRYLSRFCLAYCRRWREAALYMSVLKEVFINKRSLPAIEEIILQKSKI